MRARASIVADARDGVTLLVALRSEAPLVVRQTEDAVYLVGAAAGPLGGDELSVDVRVGAGATLIVRSAAATLAHPGRHGERSVLHTTLDVGDGASLVFRPEPLISVRGSDHTACTEVRAHGRASVRLHEDVVLGRHDEPGGRVRTRLRVVLDGESVLVHELDVGGDAPGWASGAVIGDARVVTSTLVIGADAPDEPRVFVDRAAGSAAAWLPMRHGVAMRQALGPTLAAARRAAEAI